MQRNLPPRASRLVPYHHDFSMGATPRRFKTNVWIIAISKSYGSPVVCRLAKRKQDRYAGIGCILCENWRQKRTSTSSSNHTWQLGTRMSRPISRRTKSRMIGRLPLLFLGLSAFVFAGPVWAGDFPYQQPPAEIRDVLNAPPAPVISVSPQRDYAIFLQGVRYPPIAEVAQPFLPLAGVRVDANTNGLHMAAYYVSLAIKRLPGGEDIAVALPRDGKFGAPVWSPDGKQFAFTNMIAKGIELWIGSPSTGQARRISGLSVNGVQTGGASDPVAGRQPHADRQHRPRRTRARADRACDP